MLHECLPRLSRAVRFSPQVQGFQLLCSQALRPTTGRTLEMGKVMHEGALLRTDEHPPIVLLALKSASAVLYRSSKTLELHHRT